ncbi:MAG TPA: AsmA family protein [Methylomirabilota bacterium]|nr:AsmA family protein [Methylomirabilota bacterium]
MKKSVGIGLAVVGLLIGALLIVPTFVDLSIFKRTYLPIIEESIHRRIDVSEVRLSLMPTPSIRLSNLRVSDSPAFADNIFFATQQLQLRLKLWPLLRGRFEVTEFVLEKPVINLLKKPDGTFNYADLTDKEIPLAKRSEGKKKKSAPKSQEAPTLPFVVPGRMRIKDGQLNFETKGQKSLKINGINLSVQDFTGDQSFPYQVSFSYPGLKTIALEGLLSYQEEQATLKLTGNHLKVQNLVLPIEGNITHVSTAPVVNLSSSSDSLDAKMLFQILSAFGLAPRDTEISGPMELRVTVTGPSASLLTQVHGRFKDLRVEGKRSLKGNLNGEVFIKLPLGSGSAARRLQGDGKLVAKNGELTNIDFIKKVQRVTGLIGLSKEQGREATTFKTLQADFVVGDGVADFKRIYMINPEMEVNGGGTMTLEQPMLNMALETALSAPALARTVRGRTAAFFKDGQGRMVVPLKITGPADNPIVDLDGEKLAQKGLTQSMEKGIGSLFKQLFRRR